MHVHTYLTDRKSRILISPVSVTANDLLAIISLGMPRSFQTCPKAALITSGITTILNTQFNHSMTCFPITGNMGTLLICPLLSVLRHRPQLGKHKSLICHTESTYPNHTLTCTHLFPGTFNTDMTCFIKIRQTLRGWNLKTRECFPSICF